MLEFNVEFLLKNVKRTTIYQGPIYKISIIVSNIKPLQVKVPMFFLGRLSYITTQLRSTGLFYVLVRFGV